jgi:WD40 repeat protein
MGFGETRTRHATAVGRLAPSLTVSYDGQWLAYGNTDGKHQPTIVLWSIVTKEVAMQLSLKGNAMSLAFDPSGRRLAVYGEEDRSVSVWDLESKTITKQFAATREDGLFKGVVGFRRAATGWPSVERWSCSCGGHRHL